MTCEVAIANTLAIALAADSAVTFSAGSEKTYASGANKIFQLAMQEPVAVMIYNNAALHGVPWELILKTYRNELADGGFPKLHNYCDDLTRFLNDCPPGLIPADLREAGALSARRSAALYVLKTLQAAQPVLLRSDADEQDLRDGFASAVSALQATLGAETVHAALAAADMDRDLAVAAAPLAAEITQYLETEPALAHIRLVVDVQLVAKLAIESAYKVGASFLYAEYTGVVIAGFGRDEFLPAYCNLRFYGFVGTRVLWDMKDSEGIEHGRRPSLIQAFARQAMVETFTQGASPQVWKAVGAAYEKFAYDTCVAAATLSNVALPDASIKEALNQTRQPFTDGWTYAVFDEHLKPLWRVVAGLSVEELAELAETLVLLESLKEKVTLRTQSVGGPIDVAVITKSEGLVWIKRKLYFEPKLNHRYFQRLSSTPRV